MDDDAISTVARKLEGISPKALSKAREYYRILSVRRSVSSSPGSYFERPAACLELACRSLQEPCDRKLLISICGLSSRSYELCVRSIKRLLGISSSLTAGRYSMNDICTTLGCTTLNIFASELLNRYKGLSVDSFHKKVDWNSPEFKVSAVVLTSKYREKKRLDVSTMLEKINVGRREFDHIVAEMERICSKFLTDGSACSRIKKDVKGGSSCKRKHKRSNSEGFTIASKLKQGSNTDKALVESDQNTIITQPRKRQKSLARVMQLIDNRVSNIVCTKKAAKESKTMTKETISKSEYTDWKKTLLEKMKKESK